MSDNKILDKPEIQRYIESISEDITLALGETKYVIDMNKR